MTSTDAVQKALSSPLQEASPASLEEFFSRDPGTLTEAEEVKMIEAYRRQRAVWEKEQAEEALKPKAKRGASSAPKTTLGDLGLE